MINAEDFLSMFAIEIHKSLENIPSVKEATSPQEKEALINESMPMFAIYPIQENDG